MSSQLPDRDRKDDEPSIVGVVCGLVADERGDWHGKSADGLYAILDDARRTIADLDPADREAFAAWMTGDGGA